MHAVQCLSINVDEIPRHGIRIRTGVLNVNLCDTYGCGRTGQGTERRVEGKPADVNAHARPISDGSPVRCRKPHRTRDAIDATDNTHVSRADGRTDEGRATATADRARADATERGGREGTMQVWQAVAAAEGAEKRERNRRKQIEGNHIRKLAI